MRIESLLSARLFIAPQWAGGYVYFVSDLSGRLSLYRMLARPGGSVPEPLLPPNISLQNPHLIGGESFVVYLGLGQILLMLDKDGDENYQPMLLPLDGGFPEPAFGDQLEGYRVHAARPDRERNLIYLLAESRSEPLNDTFRGDVAARSLEKVASSMFGRFPDASNSDHTRLALTEGYTVGDSVLYVKDGDQPERPVYGTPLEAREAGKDYGLSAIFSPHFVAGDQALLFVSALFEDTYGLTYLDLAQPGAPRPVRTVGLRHTGGGELTDLDHLDGKRYRLSYNIDGVSWLYEAEFDEAGLVMTVTQALAGEGAITNGVLESAKYDKATGTHVLSYSTATAPTQIYSLAPGAAQPAQHTAERVLGLPAEWLSPGEDASFESHDGLRVSARMYRPAPALGYQGARPLVYYVHGGPQGQERPDFAWFSMPLIQFLALNGFAVFVPNVRGSTGYGLRYVKHVDRDWGGQDRLDHVHAMTQVLPGDAGVDAQRAGVVGRSYGGYMTLTLAARHPELWAAAVDMFGPYNLLSFMDRIPATWKPYFAIAVGDPEKDKDFLLERSPSTYMDRITCPLLVIQGKNDPRVVEPESRDVVERLRAGGKQVDYLMFENEGHDVLKYENKVRCYNAITGFFKEHLQP